MIENVIGESLMVYNETSIDQDNQLIEVGFPGKLTPVNVICNSPRDERPYHDNHSSRFSPDKGSIDIYIYI